MDSKKLKAFVDKAGAAPSMKKIKKGGLPFGGKPKDDEEDEAGGNPGDEDEEDEGEEGGEGHEHEEEGDHAHGEGGADVDVKAIGEDVQAGNGDARLTRLSKKLTDKNVPPQWALDPDMWEEANEAVEASGTDYGDDFYVVVAHVYKEMGGELQGGGGSKGGADKKDEDESEEDGDGDGDGGGDDGGGDYGDGGGGGE